MSANAPNLRPFTDYEYGSSIDPIIVDFAKTYGTYMGNGAWMTPVDPVNNRSSVLGLSYSEYEGLTGYSPMLSDTSTASDNTGGSWRSWFSAVDTPNAVNAAVTGLLTGLSTLGTTLSSSKVFDLYKQQEQFAIRNSEEQARRIQIRGDILLANMEAKHAITQGKNELAVAASGAGSISGSFLDKLMANYKYDVRDERTQSLETLWAVSNAKREGLVEAIGTAGAAYQQAVKNRNAAITGLFSGLKAVAGSLLADKRQYDNNIADTRNIYAAYQAKQRQNDIYYGNLDTTGTEAQKFISGENTLNPVGSDSLLIN